jgi:penicillin-binding protein 1A
MLLRLIGYLFGLGSVIFFVIASGLAWIMKDTMQDLPDTAALKNYAPPVMSRIHAGDGDLIAEYALERRLFLPIQAVPPMLQNAFLAAEDKNFYQHTGIDVTGIMRAMVTNYRNRGSGRRLVGASTITQQVAKNFFLTNEVSYVRKLKEALLAVRIEKAFTKHQILELYLNEIYLGLGAYGVAAASLVYFDKSVHELSIAETAYLAALPKAPNNYHPIRYPQRAIGRRNDIIDLMARNRFITSEEGAAAKSDSLKVTPRQRGSNLFASEYFAEEVRRRLVARYGEKRLYQGGLSVRTTLDPKLQRLARKALMDGLIAYDTRNGWRGPITRLPVASGDWGVALAEVPGMSDVPEWQLAVVLGVDSAQATIGLKPTRDLIGKLSDERANSVLRLDGVKWAKRAKRGVKKVTKVTDVLRPGDVIYVQAVEDAKTGKSVWRLRQVPEVSGAIVAMDPHTGRVLALIGGFSFALSEFNRATQAWRQPGSAFKPFVYAAALDNGYTPSSVVMDAPIEIKQVGSKIWRPRNYGGKFYGPSTLRMGIERSRNVMTVRLAKDMGMALVSEYARRFGIYDQLAPLLSMSLGAGESTVLRMTSAYSVLANGGRQVKPTLIDRIQDRYGRTIMRHEERICEACVAGAWEGQDEPVIDDNREHVLDPMTAYQVTSMLEGVVTRGTAVAVGKLGKPLAGKTGTTNDERDAWFVGYSPDLAVGVFVGYDKPTPMGRGSTGGRLAAPIFKAFMKQALAGKPAIPFRVPRGIKLVPINRKTGLRASAGSSGVILESFKPGTGPPDSYDIIDIEDARGRPLTVTPEADRAVMQGTGGLY